MSSAAPLSACFCICNFVFVYLCLKNSEDKSLQLFLCLLVSTSGTFRNKEKKVKEGGKKEEGGGCFEVCVKWATSETGMPRRCSLGRWTTPLDAETARWDLRCH